MQCLDYLSCPDQSSDNQIVRVPLLGPLLYIQRSDFCCCMLYNKCWSRRVTVRTLSICLLKKHHQNKAGVQLCSPSSHLHLHILCEVGSWRHFIRPRPVYIDPDPAGCSCCCPALQASSGALSHSPKPSASQGAWPACGSGAQQLSLTAPR